MKTLGMISFSFRLRKLSEKITQDIISIYTEAGIKYDLRYGPILVILSKKKKIISNDISETLGFTRSAISQTINDMYNDGLIELKTSNTDRRKRWINLTVKGIEMVKQLKPIWAKAEKIFYEIEKDTGVNLLEFITSLEETLEEKSILQRYLCSLSL